MADESVVLVVDEKVMSLAAEALYRAFRMDDSAAFISHDFMLGHRIAIDGEFHVVTLVSVIFSELTSGLFAKKEYDDEQE